MSGCARFILVNYKQDLLGKNTVNNIGTFVLKGNELVFLYRVFKSISLKGESVF